MLRVKSLKKAMIAFILALAIMISMPAAVLANTNTEAATPNISISGDLPSHGGVPYLIVYFSNYNEFPNGIYVIPKVEVYSNEEEGVVAHEEELAPVKITSWSTNITFNEDVTEYLNFYESIWEGCTTDFRFTLYDSYYNVIAEQVDSWHSPPPA